MSKVLVTGASGYVGTQLIAALLSGGARQAVRAQVREAAREDGLRAAVRRGGADDAGVEVVTADLMSDDGWKEVMRAGWAGVFKFKAPKTGARDRPLSATRGTKRSDAAWAGVGIMISRNGGLTEL